MKIKVVDSKKRLVDAVSRIGIEAVWREYFSEAEQTPNAVLMTASNPAWTFGGGIDLGFKSEFPDLVKKKQRKGGGMERMGNICFCITVDENLRATKKAIRDAIAFAISQTADHEVLLVSGVGTGIGGLSVEEFVEVLEDVL